MPVEVEIALLALDLTLVGVLPHHHLALTIIVHGVVPLGYPQTFVLKALVLKSVSHPIEAGVESGLIALLLHKLHELKADIRKGLLVLGQDLILQVIPDSAAYFPALDKPFHVADLTLHGG